MYYMANEATLIIETELPINMTCANATGIEKGALLKLTDPNTAIINSGYNDVVAGIAAAEKIASDGCTKVSVYRQGIFKVTLSGACVAGDELILDKAANKVDALTYKNMVLMSGSNVIGIALETGADGETILMELSPRSTLRGL